MNCEFGMNRKNDAKFGATGAEGNAFVTGGF